jgi:hypothetical protein
MEMYLEIQEVARLIYNYRDSLVNIKRHVTSLLTSEHKKMNKKNLLNAFEDFFDTIIAEKQSNVLIG